MKSKVIDYSENSSLISSILFLILGVVLFTNPGGIVKFISYILGGLLIIIGIINILSYRKTLKNLNVSNQSTLISGIVLIVLGLVAIICSSVIETVIRLIIGAWVLYSGVMRLIGAFNYQQNKTSFYVRLVIAGLLILVGLYIILKTNLFFSGIGLFIIIYSVLEIVGYIFYSKK